MKRNKVPAKEEDIFAQSGSVDVRKERCGKVPPTWRGGRGKKKRCHFVSFGLVALGDLCDASARERVLCSSGVNAMSESQVWDASFELI